MRTAIQRPRLPTLVRLPEGRTLVRLPEGRQDRQDFQDRQVRTAAHERPMNRVKSSDRFGGSPSTSSWAFFTTWPALARRNSSLNSNSISHILGVRRAGGVEHFLRPGPP